MAQFNIKKIELEDSQTHDVVFRSKDEDGKKGVLELLNFILKKYGENYLKSMDEAAGVLKEWDQDITDALKKVVGKK